MSCEGAKSWTRVKYCLNDEALLWAGTGGRGLSCEGAVVDCMRCMGAVIDAEF